MNDSVEINLPTRIKMEFQSLAQNINLDTILRILWILFAHVVFKLTLQHINFCAVAWQSSLWLEKYWSTPSYTKWNETDFVDLVVLYSNENVKGK